MKSRRWFSNIIISLSRLYCQHKWREVDSRYDGRHYHVHTLWTNTWIKYTERCLYSWWYCQSRSRCGTFRRLWLV